MNKVEILILENNYYKLNKLLLYWKSQIKHEFTYSEIINYIINKEYWELMQQQEFRDVIKGEENNEY